jgi:hypothetical protein
VVLFSEIKIVTITPRFRFRFGYPDAWTARVGFSWLLFSGVEGGNGVRERHEISVSLLFYSFAHTFINSILKLRWNTE